MKVLFCASEALPFAATGGLADVAGSLPKAIRSKKISCAVVMPLYESTMEKFKDDLTFVTSISVPVSWRRQYCGIYEATVDHVVYYFIDNQYYFKRAGFYGHFDDAERFAFFSRAILEILPHIDFKPDVIHANDWQTALVPIYYRLLYANNDWYKGIKTLFTIHNIQYQGQYSNDLLGDVFGIPAHDSYLTEWENSVNLMKGAIESANRVSTVSPSYAKEILDPWFAHRLDPILRERAWKLSGILNGIDGDVYNPATDKDVFVNYSVDDMAGKAENKKLLQKRLGLELDPKVPLISMVTRLVSHKGLNLVKDALDNIMQYTNSQFVVLGSGDFEYENYFKQMQEKYPKRFIACFGFVPELSKKIYAGSDIFLMPSKSEPCGLSQMISLRYGTIPVVREVGGLKDSISDCRGKDGNGYTFKTYNSGDMLNSLHAAIYAYNSDKDSWAKLVKNAMLCDNSWNKSAGEYINLFKEMVNE